MKKSSKPHKSFMFVWSDIFSVLIAYWLTLHFDDVLVDAVKKYWQLSTWANILIAEIIYVGFFALNGIYKNLIKYVSVRFFMYLGLVSLSAGTILTVVSHLMYRTGFFMTWKRNLLAMLFVCCLVVAVRGLVRINPGELIKRKNRNGYTNLLIVGAGSAGQWLINSIQSNKNAHYNVVGIIDDNPDKLGKIIHGIKVIGRCEEIVEVCERHKAEEIVVAIPSMDTDVQKAVYDHCAKTGLPVKTLPTVDEIVSGAEMGDAFQHLRSVNIEDLLARKPVKLDNEQLHSEIYGKVIMVTGGGGSIGSELCRQIAKHKPSKLIILDIYENNAYDLQMELQSLYPELDLRVVIASVRDEERIYQVFADYKPVIVFHAAAHKHVPLMEYNPGESIKNNVFGTYNVAKAADKYGAKKFVLISTDKAVNPTNIMGATKRICEMIVQSMQEISKTEFVAVRFGNVLGSNGSVIPLFKKQIENREPITVTHKEITRFFMTIPEAAQLVLQAACYAKGGEIFVLDMGQPVKIYDLAVNLIRLSGLKPFVDIDIKITGLRPGEKLYEELLMDEEGLKETANSKIFIGQPIFINMETLKKSLDKLEKAMISDDKEHIKDIVAEVVPTYIRNIKHKTKTEEADVTA